MNKQTEKTEAVAELRDMGAVLEKKEDRHGETKSGWWIHDVYLGKDPVEALRLTRG